MNEVIKFVKDFTVPTVIAIATLVMYAVMAIASRNVFSAPALVLLLEGVGITIILYFVIYYTATS